jgi:hypothetical protein
MVAINHSLRWGRQDWHMKQNIFSHFVNTLAVGNLDITFVPTWLPSAKRGRHSWTLRGQSNQLKLHMYIPRLRKLKFELLSTDVCSATYCKHLKK